jgi:monoamine oxidase
MSRIPAIIKKLRSAPELYEGQDITRRSFIRHSSQLLATGAAVQTLANCRSSHAPNIVIVGAGLSGLTAAYHLEKAGLKVQILEAQGRVGGRIISANNLIADGITTEMGGEFIDSTHKDILTFCREFNLDLMDMKAASEKKLIGTDYSFGGKRISEKQIIDEFGLFSERMKKDIDALPESMSPKHPKLMELDRLSIDEYLHKIGMSGWLFDILTTSFTSELGIPSGDQSSLNMLVSLNPDVTKGFEIYGDSDERFKVAGGNERIVTELRKRIKSEIKTGYHLRQINADGSGYKLSFDNSEEVKAEIVLITLPFSVLRDVQMKIDLPARKRKCIDELGYGMQSKLFIGVNDRIWRGKGYSGYVLSDKIHNGWDSSQMQHNNLGPGSYSLFLGADKGKNLELSQYDAYLNECDKVFPGMKSAANGRKNLYNWNQNPMVRGAYACYKVGQVSGIGGAESEAVGNLFFAGEHCSDNFQGFMNGAAETGRKAAENIIRKMGTAKPG